MLTYSFCKSVGTVLTFFSYFKPSNTQLYGYMSPTVIENTYNSVHAAGSYGSWLVNAVPCSYIQGLLFNFFFFFFFIFAFCSDCASMLCKPDFCILAAFGSRIFVEYTGSMDIFGQREAGRSMDGKKYPDLSLKINLGRTF